MGLVTFERFGGLDLASDPAEVGGQGCIDCMNVEFDRVGRVRTRRGFDQFDTGAIQFDYLAQSGRVLLGFDRNGTSSDIYTIAANGTVTSLGSISVASNHPALTSVAMVGTATATYTYIATWDFLDGVPIRRFDNASTLATGAGVGGNSEPKYLAAWQNRLVQGNYSAAGANPAGGAGSPSTVFFSNAGAPDTYTATDFVLLSPGDGETITGMATWRELLFVFKETAMYVFHSTSVDSTGGAIFNYRKVDLGRTVARDSILEDNLNWSVVAGHDGVYFAAVDGIYKTTGDVPTKISSGLDTLFDGDLVAQVFWAADRLHVKGTTAYPWLVYDPNKGDWSAWDIPMSRVVGWKTFSGDIQERIYFLASSSDARTPSKHVFTATYDFTDDNGTAIPWRWQSGFYEIGGPRALSRMTELWGTSTVTADVFTDYATSDPLSRGTAVALGASPAVAKGYHVKSYQGDLFSHRLSGSGVASVNRLVHHL